MLMNVIRNCGRQQVAYRASFRNAAADIGSGNLQPGNSQFGDPATSLQRQLICNTAAQMIMPLQITGSTVNAFFQRISGAISHHDMRQFEQSFPFAPGMQLQKCISTHQQAKRLFFSKFCAHFAQGVHRVTGIAAPYFTVIQLESRLIGNCQPHHCTAMPCGYLRLVAMWRNAGRHETDFAEIGKFQHFFGQAQVPEMNRIERAAQYAYRFQTGKP